MKNFLKQTSKQDKLVEISKHERAFTNFLEFCKKNTEFCKTNTNTIYKFILEYHGFKTDGYPSSTTVSPPNKHVYYDLFRELLKLKREISPQGDPDIKGYFKIDQEFLVHIFSNGSRELIEFIKFNGFKKPASIKIPDTIKIKKPIKMFNGPYSFDNSIKSLKLLNMNTLQSSKSLKSIKSLNTINSLKISDSIKKNTPAKVLGVQVVNK